MTTQKITTNNRYTTITSATTTTTTNTTTTTPTSATTTTTINTRNATKTTTTTDATDATTTTTTTSPFPRRDLWSGQISRRELPAVAVVVVIVVEILLVVVLLELLILLVVVLVIMIVVYSSTSNQNDTMAFRSQASQHTALRSERLQSGKASPDRQAQASSSHTWPTPPSGKQVARSIPPVASRASLQK